MRESLVYGAPLAGVQHQNLVQQVTQLVYLLELVLGQALVVDQLCGQIPSWLNCGHDHGLLPLRHSVDLVREEIAVGVKVLLLEGAFSDHLVGKFAFQVHEILQHLVVGIAREHDFARVQLVNRAASRPHVDAVAIRNTQD